nr:integrase, catalytic region, zinc finger, CCHC-type, peptidase aspartic, catalytic [Tanacetum cinerariifolium]
MFTDIGYRWKPTGQTFTIDGNTCPLTRITSTKVVPLKETTSKTNNGTEFVNQTLRAYYKDVEISHQTSFARTSQQNGIVEIQNCTLVEAAYTMLIFSKAPLFLWVEAIVTACFTQNGSLIQKRHNKIPYELIHNKKPDLSYLYVFGALFYPTNNSEDLGKFKPKADIEIFVGYAPTKKASGLGPELLTFGTISLGLMLNPPSLTTYVPPTKKDWDILFHPMSADPPSSNAIDQDAPTPSTSPTPQEILSLVIPSSVEEHFHDIEVAQLDNNPFFGVPIP